MEEASTKCIVSFMIVIKRALTLKASSTSCACGYGGHESPSEWSVWSSLSCGFVINVVIVFGREYMYVMVSHVANESRPRKVSLLPYYACLPLSLTLSLSHRHSDLQICSNIITLHV